MHQLEITTHFSAAHAITMGEVVEPLHGHDWHVTVTVEGESLDADGLLVDFHWLQGQLAEVIAPFHNQNLNTVDPFRSGLNPTAEHVAGWISQSLSDRLATGSGNRPKDHSRPVEASATSPLAPHVRIARVRVTEAIGCAAVYIPHSA